MENDREIIFDVEKKAGLSADELNVSLAKWQEKLQMSDWILSVEVVEFRRKNGYRQSGDFTADPSKKTAQILMTNDPWRDDEEYTLVHELLHVLFYDYDKNNEEELLKTYPKFGPEHDAYMDRLEELVHQMTRIILGRSDR